MRWRLYINKKDLSEKESLFMGFRHVWTKMWCFKCWFRDAPRDQDQEFRPLTYLCYAFRAFSWPYHTSTSEPIPLKERKKSPVPESCPKGGCLGSYNWLRCPISYFSWSLHSRLYSKRGFPYPLNWAFISWEIPWCETQTQFEHPSF